MNAEQSLAEDPAQAFAAEMGFDFLDFCMDQLEREISESNQPGDDLDENAFQASWQLKSAIHTYQLAAGTRLPKEMLMNMLKILKTLPTQRLRVMQLRLMHCMNFSMWMMVRFPETFYRLLLHVWRMWKSWKQPAPLKWWPSSPQSLNMGIFVRNSDALEGANGHALLRVLLLQNVWAKELTLHIEFIRMRSISFETSIFHWLNKVLIMVQRLSLTMRLSCTMYSVT